MNIKSEQAHELARALARLTGESMTQAVTTALRERLDRLDRQDDDRASAEEILAIGREVGARLVEPWRSVDHGDLLYDEFGLPK